MVAVSWLSDVVWSGVVFIRPHSHMIHGTAVMDGTIPFGPPLSLSLCNEHVAALRGPCAAAMKHTLTARRLEGLKCQGGCWGEVH
jgi:hypothetical protein